MAAKDDYQDFKDALNDLKINSKPVINFLTILAEEKLHNAPQIVRAVEERVIEVSIHLKKKKVLLVARISLKVFNSVTIPFGT